jgi:hypothetical protein
LVVPPWAAGPAKPPQGGTTNNRQSTILAKPYGYTLKSQGLQQNQEFSGFRVTLAGSPEQEGEDQEFG